MPAGIREQYEHIPKAVKVFVFRSVLLIVLWNLLYKLLLEPSGIPDMPMCHFFCHTTAATMSLFYPACYVKGLTVFVNNWPVININPACNALDLLVIYIGFMVCLPTGTRKILRYALWGSLAILFFNYLRFLILSYMVLHKMPITNFAHHYIFTAVVYGFIFLLWRKYSKDYEWK